MKHFVIIRRAVLMEDEGRENIVKVCRTRAEAETWIAKQAGEYFGSSDYYIAVPLEEDKK